MRQNGRVGVGSVSPAGPAKTAGVRPPRPDHRRRSEWWYAIVVVTLPSAALALCVAAVRLGESRDDNVLSYFYEESDVGHPGIVNVVTTMGFCSVAVVALLLALVSAAHTMQNLAWIGMAVLFSVLAVDNVLRLHAQVRGGDKGVHVVYWLAMAAVAAGLWRVLHRRRGSWMLLGGLSLLAASEAIDMFTRSDDAQYRYHEQLAVLEESFACVGAWCCVAGVLGLASVLVVHSGAEGTDGTR